MTSIHPVHFYLRGNYGIGLSSILTIVGQIQQQCYCHAKNSMSSKYFEWRFSTATNNNFLNKSRRTRRGKMSISIIMRSEEHTSELQSLAYLVCRLLLEK